MKGCPSPIGTICRAAGCPVHFPEVRDQGCPLPPAGWWCSLPPGHDGPCPARQDLDAPEFDPAQWIDDAIAEYPEIDVRRLVVARWFGMVPTHPLLAGLTGALDEAARRSRCRVTPGCYQPRGHTGRCHQLGSVPA